MNSNFKVRPEIENMIAKKCEGGLYVCISMFFFGNNWSFSKWHYTVENGIVYELSGKKKTPTGDTCFDLDKDSKRIGKYDPDKEYRQIHREFEYKDMKKLLKL